MLIEAVCTEAEAGCQCGQAPKRKCSRVPARTEPATATHSGYAPKTSNSAPALHFHLRLKRLYSEGSRYNQKYNLMQQQGTFEPLGDV